MALQKVFLLPPLKGLNLYDNPFTLSQDFAVSLVNFMPPTTTLKVRPGFDIITTINGQVKGLHSYTTGISENYGSFWFLSNIKYGAASLILIKTTYNDSTTHLLALKAEDNTVSDLGVISNSQYNDDTAMYRHTMFFTSGDTNSAMYCYHQEKGLAKFALQIGDDGSQEVGDMFNITIFKDWVFCSGNNSLNIYFIKSQYADIVDPVNKSWWREVENIFTPHFGATFSLDGIVQAGGSILKLCCISRSGSDSISAYLCAITNQGEIVLFDGTDPSDTTGQKWQTVGRFKISPPLNKFCFCDMEGDLVVATANGLVSLRRVVFGQASAITENLEYKLMSLFEKYMFKIPAYREFIGLYYFERSRLLIFNIPEDLPMAFNKIVSSYNFDKNKALTFNPEFSDEVKQSLLLFVKSYCLKELIEYWMYIELNSDFTVNCFFFECKLTRPPYDDPVQATFRIRFGIKINNVETEFLSQDYLCPDLEDINLPIEQIGDLHWNEDLLQINPFNPSERIYCYRFSDELEVTNILPFTQKFYMGKWATTLQNCGFNQQLYDTLPDAKNLKISDLFVSTLANGERAYNVFFLSWIQFWSSKEFLGVETVYDPATNWWTAKYKYPDDIGIFTIPYFAKQGASEVSYFKLLLNWIFTNPDAFADANGLSWDVSYRLKNKIEITLGPGYDTVGFIETYLFFVVHRNTNGDGVAIDGSLTWTEQILDDDGYKLLSTSTGKAHFNATNGTEPISEKPFTEIEVSVHPEDFVEGKYDFTGLTGLYFANGGDYPTIHWELLSELNSMVDGSIAYTIQKSLNENVIDAKWEKYGHMYSHVLVNSSPYPAEILDEKNKVSKPRDFPMTYTTNVDLAAIPFFNGVNIACNFGSTQYVFDSHFGTWSSWKDVNMVKGIEHQNNFYFIVPKNVSYASDTDQYVFTSSYLCKLNQTALGDADISIGSNDKRVFINVAYDTQPTFDMSLPNKKFFKRIKMFGSPSAFWQTDYVGEFPTPPLWITPVVDFKDGMKIAFPHWNNGYALSQRLLSKHFNNSALHNLSFKEKKKFWQLYADAASQTTYINIPLIAPSGTRLGLKCSMQIREAFVELYGFEILFETGGLS